jgi:hypothetical protein
MPVDPSPGTMSQPTWSLWQQYVYMQQAMAAWLNGNGEY